MIRRVTCNDATPNSPFPKFSFHPTAKAFDPVNPLRLYLVIPICLIAQLIACPAASSIAVADNEIQLIDGQMIAATIESISPQGLATGPGIDGKIQLENIAAYQTQATAVTPGSIEILIAGQGKIFTTNITVNDSTAKVSLVDGTQIDVPLEIIRAIAFKRTERVTKELTNPSDSQDIIVVNTAGGEKTVAGIFEGLGQGKVSLNFNGKSRKISVEKINGIVLANLGLKPLEGAKIELTDRSQISGRLQQVTDGQAILAVTSTAVIRLPWTSVTQMELESDNLEYLSNLEPIEFQQKSIFAPQRSWQRDRSVESNPLRLHEPNTNSYLNFRKGIGTQSFCELKFENTHQFRRFQAVAGIDVETNGRGDCQMSVYADGIQLWSQRITAKTPPASIDVDITGMKVLTLVVEPGRQFDLADHANWADAKFVKP
jgi:hypothetical protein